jgi:hypothetical protein
VRVPAIAPGKQRTVKSKVPPGALTAITQHKRKGVLLDAQGPFGFPLYSIRVKN